jgi:hypothetical protein
MRPRRSKRLRTARAMSAGGRRSQPPRPTEPDRWREARSRRARWVRSSCRCACRATICSSWRSEPKPYRRNIRSSARIRAIRSSISRSSLRRRARVTRTSSAITSITSASTTPRDSGTSRAPEIATVDAGDPPPAAIGHLPSPGAGGSAGENNGRTGGNPASGSRGGRIIAPDHEARQSATSVLADSCHWPATAQVRPNC